MTLSIHLIVLSIKKSKCRCAAPTEKQRCGQFKFQNADRVFAHALLQHILFYISTITGQGAFNESSKVNYDFLITLKQIYNTCYS
jgi:hypothetical protein